MRRISAHKNRVFKLPFVFSKLLGMNKGIATRIIVFNLHTIFVIVIEPLTDRSNANDISLRSYKNFATFTN